MTEPYRKKLIEVALPLEAINRESALRKRKAPAGYPATIHKWWSGKPLATCRAVLFASIVDDPSSRPDLFPSEEEQERERQRLFRIIEELVKWENSNNEEVLAAARAEIMNATGGNPPFVLDPFCGGGSIPLEAQRLGLASYASDLNPVAVLITKALVEIPPKFAGRPPVNPDSRAGLAHGATWKGVQGLAEDIRYYGKWIHDEAYKRIGHLYPRVKLSHGEAMPIAWLWARTVTCPNPACGIAMPLASKFWLSTKQGKEVYADPVVEPVERTVRFEVQLGPGAREGSVNRRGATCVNCGTAVPFDHIRSEGKAGRLGTELMAVVANAGRKRVYLSPSEEHKQVAASPPEPHLVPETDLPERALGFRVQGYGMRKHRDLFTARQLIALATLGGLVREVSERVVADEGDSEYGDAVATYLGLVLSRVADYGNALSTWRPKDSAMRSLFTQQSVPMAWDFAEGNPFASASSGVLECVEVIARCVERLPARSHASVSQLDATAATFHVGLVCSDPPYYDNIGYADLSDFFYVWLRQSLGSIYPDLFATLLTPKTGEIVATPFRFDGDRGRAERFFEKELGSAFIRLRSAGQDLFPLTLFYAFKQAESDGDGAALASTGWEKMLTGLLASELCVTGTWPMRTEGDNRQMGIGANALAASIVLVCRPRDINERLVTRRDFVTALKVELPDALRKLQHGNIAPVDLAQAAIGPGMAIFSRYVKVVEADGSAMTVRTALGLINDALDEILAEQEGDFDPDTRFAIAWFEQRGMAEGPFGDAETLSKAKNVGINGLVEAGILESKAGKVRLLIREELDPRWDPTRDRRLTVWEVTHHLVKRLEDSGEGAASDLLGRVGGLGVTARELAYRLYTVCERKRWAQEALGYNALVVAWPEIARLAAAPPADTEQQTLGV